MQGHTVVGNKLSSTASLSDDAPALPQTLYAHIICQRITRRLPALVCRSVRLARSQRSSSDRPTAPTRHHEAPAVVLRSEAGSVCRRARTQRTATVASCFVVQAAVLSWSLTGVPGLQESQLKSPLPNIAATALVLAGLGGGPALAAGQAPTDALYSLSAIVPGLLGDSPLREGFVSAFLLILFSELGDKTFFIAVLLALKNKQQRWLVFGGTFGALAVMTVISVAIGLVFHEIDETIASESVPFDDLIAVALLLYFGIKTLREAGNADEKAKEEEEDAQGAVDSMSSSATGLVLSTFLLVFAAEWGDKSFLATIALAAASSPVGVVAGAVAGHGAATLLAVLGGSYLGNYVSERVVQYVGGSLFLVFALGYIIDIVRGDF